MIKITADALAFCAFIIFVIGEHDPKDKRKELEDDIEKIGKDLAGLKMRLRMLKDEIKEIESLTGKNATDEAIAQKLGISESEYADWTRPFVHTNGNLGADSIAPIHTAGLDSVYVAVLDQKIAEMKETAGNRDVSNGGTAAGVTAATAIAALQESSGKLSRNMIDDGYEAFADVVTLCIELVRQFYDAPRRFRLLGEHGEWRYVNYMNAGLQPVAMDDGFGVSYRVPEFDLEIGAEQENPYRTMEYNQLAMQLFQMGFFREDMADQAEKCLGLMEFKNKEEILRLIGQGRTQQAEIQRLRERLLEVAQVVDAAKGSHLTQALEKEFAQTSDGKMTQTRKEEKVSAMDRMRKNVRQAVHPR